MRKTPFQRHREEEEKKKKRAEEEAAKLYEDFVESFGEKEEEKLAPKSFIRGETIQPGSASTAGESDGRSVRKAGSKYVPKFMPPMMAAAISGKPEDADIARKSDESVFPLPSSARGDRGKTRNIDKMLETMKRDQEARTERQRQRRERGSSFDVGPDVDDGMGSFDDGDPFTTNLYVGNLAPDVDEEVLKREFLRYGDIASIKIMWPRDEDQKRRGRNCGFVAFMTRDGAERAKDELNGAILHDLDLRIGWGKAVVLPPIPMYTSSGVGGLAPMMAAARAIAQAPPPGQQAAPPWTGPEREADPHSGTGPDLVIKAPEDWRVRFIIDSVATYVMVDGCAFEQALMTKEAGNPEFMFLFDLNCPEHAYYRWRLYSLAQGDSLRSWRNEPFVMIEGGQRWVPPSMTAFSSGRQQTAAQRGGEAKEKDKPLSELQRDRFEDVLRALTMDRSKICNAMVFALDNADSAFEIVETLTDSLTLPETPMSTKVARLMLASDILHNSTAHVHNASRYRSLLEASLPDVFESLQDTYRSLDSRMHQEVLRRNVLRVLRIWRSWFIFSDDFLNGLQATFLKGKTGDAENPTLRAELEALDPDALAIKCRRNGLSREGDRQAQLQRLINLQAYLSGDMKPEPLATPANASVQDKLPMGLTEDSQGVFTVNAQPADVKSEPAAAGSVLGGVAKPPAVKEEPKPADGPVSKWTLVDYNDDSAAFLGPKEEEPDDIFPDLEKTPVVARGQAPIPVSSPEPAALDPNSSSPTGEAAEKPAEGRAGGERMDAADEGRRARLRQVEVDLLLFREGLEDEGLPKSEVETRVEEHRAKLIANAEKQSAPAANPSTSERATDEGLATSKDSSRRDKPKESKKEQKRARSSSPAEERRREKDNTKGRGSSKDKAGNKEKERDKRDRKMKDSRRRSRSRSRSREHWRSRSRSRDRERERMRRRSRSRSKSRSRSRGRDRDQSHRRSHSRERPKEVSRERGSERDSRRTKATDSHGRRSSSRSPARQRDKERDKDKRKRERSASRERESKETWKDAAASKQSSKKSSKEGRDRSRSKSPKKSKHSKESRKK